MRMRSNWLWTGLAALALAVPGFAQETPAPATAQTGKKQVEKDQATPGTEVVRTEEDIRERILLDRIDRLEKRLAEVEARTAAAEAHAPAPSTAAVAATSSQAPAPAAAASTPAASPAPQESAPASAPTWSAGPIDFSGRISAYYTLNFNHPASMNNQLYNFNTKANQFGLDMAEINMDHTPDPIGFNLDLGFGRAFDIIAGSEPQPSIFRNIRQAYVSVKPASAKGLEVDFGKFVTSDGAEVIETDTNWNYTHSLLFAWAIPYYHFGVRATYPVSQHFTTGVMVANGWNNVEDNNSGKLVMFMETFTAKKFTVFANFHTGPENPGTNKGWRHLFDTTLLLTPSPKFSAYINYDYGHNQNPPGVLTPLGHDAAVWYGVATALHFQTTAHWSFTPRVEWFKDRDGFATGSGISQDLKEFTMTGEYKMAEGLLGRLEYRRDWSNKPFFDRGINPASHKNQDTFTLGFLAYFGPKR